MKKMNRRQLRSLISEQLEKSEIKMIVSDLERYHNMAEMAVENNQKKMLQEALDGIWRVLDTLKAYSK